MASIPLLRLSLRPTAAVTTTTHPHHHHRQASHSPAPLFFHPLKSAATTLLPALAMKSKSKTPKNPRIIAMSSSSTTPATDRLIASIGYFLPFLNGLHYGRFLFAQYPKLSLLVEPLLPVFSLQIGALRQLRRLLRDLLGGRQEPYLQPLCQVQRNAGPGPRCAAGGALALPADLLAWSGRARVQGDGNGSYCGVFVGCDVLCLQLGFYHFGSDPILALHR